MILEDIDGNIQVTLEGKQLVVGTYFEDSKYSMVLVIGTGKATFRVDPNCTIEKQGVTVFAAMAAGLGLPEPIVVET